MTTDLKFAHKLVADKQHVLHAKHSIVGIPTRAFASNEFIGVECVVLQFDDGNAFVVNGNHNEFVQLTEAEYLVYQKMLQELREVIVGAVLAMRVSDPAGERMAHGKAVITAALAVQVRALDA